jgi:hypothetical protein
MDMNSIDAANNFYKRHIYDLEKINLLRKYNLKIAGSVPPVLWELFGSLLTERQGAGTTGADLRGWEVKSAKRGSSYEYQYHLNTGAQKLKDDSKVNHLFCSYSETYEDVIVRAIKGADLDKYFKAWGPAYHDNYSSQSPSTRRQRFRKSIPYGLVEQKGTLILEISGGGLMRADRAIIREFNKLT